MNFQNYTNVTEGRVSYAINYQQFINIRLLITFCTQSSFFQTKKDTTWINFAIFALLNSFSFFLNF